MRFTCKHVVRANHAATVRRRVGKLLGSAMACWCRLSRCLWRVEMTLEVAQVALPSSAAALALL